MSTIKAKVRIYGVSFWIDLPLETHVSLLEALEKERDKIEPIVFSKIIEDVIDCDLEIVVECYIINTIDKIYYEDILLGRLIYCSELLGTLDYNVKYLDGFIEFLGIKNLDDFDNWKFYNDKEELLETFYIESGLSEKKLLFSTVDSYMDEKKVLEHLLVNGYEASNGVVILK